MRLLALLLKSLCVIVCGVWCDVAWCVCLCFVCVCVFVCVLLEEFMCFVRVLCCV